MFALSQGEVAWLGGSSVLNDPVRIFKKMLSFSSRRRLRTWLGCYLVSDHLYRLTRLMLPSRRKRPDGQTSGVRSGLHAHGLSMQAMNAAPLSCWV